MQAKPGLFLVVYLHVALHVLDENTGGTSGCLQGIGEVVATLQRIWSHCSMDGQYLQVVHGGHREDPHPYHAEPGQMAGGPHGQQGGD